MRQVRILLLLLLFLHSKIGVAINIHYCGDHIAEISWFFDAKGCGMETPQLPSTDQTQFSASECCADETILEQDTNNQIHYDFDTINAVPLLVSYDEIQKSVVPTSQIVIKVFARPPPKRPQYKLNCAYLVYG